MTKKKPIAAGIDLGSNTFRLLIADCTGGSMKVLVKQLAAVRLGRGLEEKEGLLQENSMQRGFKVLRSFRQALDQFSPESIRICGTEALRRAKNSRFFLNMAEDILQQKIDIVDGEEEACLSFTGTLAGIKKEVIDRPLLVIDVGGGSTELIFSQPSAKSTVVLSMPLGVVSLTEKFLDNSPPDLSGLDCLLTAALTETLSSLKLQGKDLLLIGCGGTATSMAALDLKLISYNESMVHGHVLDSTTITRLWKKLIALPADKRNALPCLGDGRGEILPAGIRIYHILLKVLQLDQMRVSDTGLLEGVLLSALSHTVA